MSWALVYVVVASVVGIVLTAASAVILWRDTIALPTEIKVVTTLFFLWMTKFFVDMTFVMWRLG